MALANTLLYELTNNRLSRSIDLVQLALRSPVYIPQKREIIVSWITRTIEDRERSKLTSDEAGTLWNILLSLVDDMQPLEVAMVVQDSFLKAMQDELEHPANTDYAECLLKTMTALIQKAPQSTLALKFPALVKLVSVTLKQCCLCTNQAELLDHLCLTASALMEVVLSSWYQHPCSIQESFGHLNPLLSNMMYILHFKEAEASEAVQKVHKTIKKFVHACFFLRNNITAWLMALYEYLRMDGWNAVVPLSKEQEEEFEKRKGKKIKVEPEEEPEDGDVHVNEKMVEVLQAEPHRQGGARKDDEYLLEQLMKFFNSVLQKEDMALSKEQQLYYLNKLLAVYQASEQYCLVVVMPQFKRSLFKPRRWFGELAAKLHPLEYKNTAWFECMGTIMRIAPNLVEGSMIKTLQKCWRVCGSEQPGLPKARSLLLESILATYTELFRVPKLIRNIFSSFTNMGTMLSETSIPVSFLHKFAACCINLPPGQLTETWQFLVNQLSYWTSGSATGNVPEDEGSKEPENHLPKVLVVTEIFRTFAHHIQVVNPTTPPVYVTKICELMQATCQLATQMLDLSIEKESKQHAQCALSVFHLWGELHLVLCLYRRSYGEAYMAPELTAPLEATDLSFLHPSITADKMESLLDMMKTDSTKLICYHLMLLWIQKIRALILFTDVTNEHLEGSLQATAKLVFSHVEMTVGTSAWSQRVQSCFPVVSLHTLLVNFPLLSPYLPAKSVTALCQFFFEVMVHTKDEDVVDRQVNALTQTEIITTYLGSQAFIECKLAQTCYVTALWGRASTLFKARKRKLDSEEEPRGLFRSLTDTLSGPIKWEKYAETVPQADYSSKQLLSSEGLNKMWAAIHAASEQLAVIIATSSENFGERISVADVSFLLEVKEVISSAKGVLSKAHTSAALVLFKELVLELRRKPHEDVKGYIQKMAHTMSEGMESWLQRLLHRTKPSAEIRRHIYTIGLLQAQYTFCSQRLSVDSEVSDSSCSRDTLAALSMATAELQNSEWKATNGAASVTLENCIADKHYKLMETFFQACTLEELKDILGDLVSTLMKDNVQSVPMKVHLQVLQLVCSCVDNQKQDGTAKDIMSIIHRIIEYFAVILSLYDIADHPEIVVYVLKFFTTLLTMRRVVLSHRGGVVILQSLSSLNLLHLWSKSQEHFCQSVMAASRLLSIFLSKRIVMVVGLVGEIASHKKEFSKTGGFLIADYILESINTVLHPPIKKTLQFLVYKLFELADEHRRGMVHATLPKEGTEVFKTLFAESKRLRFKGKV
ncbi:hypothetical protein HPB50_021171 [Hyalomma asiaticum]|uniref:Uncharacterized protein n=1 Tax=Hyalomma asiaticum TaxID=266040 RepID=A0ACB7SAN9_HYAAI|nr:hypothetical protein HPB50_021171 [Hyalomma asiaticum]